MAPSAKISKARVGNKQATLHGFGRVSKIVPSPVPAKLVAKQAGPSTQTVKKPQQTCEGKRTKRRREDDSDLEQYRNSTTPDTEVSRPKKPKLQLPTPPLSLPSSESDASPISPPCLPSLRLQTTSKKATPSTRPSTPEDLPTALSTLISLHSFFLKALSIHYAHNGPSAPAEISGLLKTITCLWKKTRLVKADIQRMLALYEIAEDEDIMPGNHVYHRVGPFKLTVSGLGSFNRTCVEYTGGGPTSSSNEFLRMPFSEKTLQILYEACARTVSISSRSNTDHGFVNGPLVTFPQLVCSLGTQTAVRQEKASVRRNEILGLKAHIQPQPNLQVPNRAEVEAQTSVQIAEAVKSRTQSLFDRVKAKQLANSALTAPTAESVLRWHAIGRITEIVEILRMKQQQKMGAAFVSSVHLSPSKVKSKVSFSMSQIVNEIRNSVAVPIEDEEVEMCMHMLANELPGIWISVFEIGDRDTKVKSVVLNGNGMSGREVQRVLEQQERRRTI